MRKKLSIELQEELIRFIVSGHRSDRIDILEVLETDYELEKEEGDEKKGAEGEAEESKDLVDRGILKIQQVLKNKRWDKLKKTLLYNIGDLTPMVLELPLVPDDEMEEAVTRKVSGENLLGEGDEIAFEVIGAKDNKGLHGVYVHIIPKSLLDKLQVLKIQGIDFEVFAVNRRQITYTTPKENTMFLDIGEKQTSVTIYLKEKMALARKLNTGKADIIDEIQKVFGIQREEALELNKKYGFVDTLTGSELLDKGELRGMDLAEIYEGMIGKMERKVFQYLDYFQFRHSGESLKTLYYSGGNLESEELSSHLKKTFYIENVFRYNHLQGISTENLREGTVIGNEYSALLGTVESKHGIKFIGRTFKLPFKVKKNPIYALIATAFFLFMASRYGYYKLQEVDQIKRLDSISSRQKEIQEDLDEYNAVQKKIKNLKGEIAYLSGITGKNTIFNNFLSDLSYKIDPNIFIEDISYSGDKVSLRGRAVSGTAYAEVYINELVRELEGVTKEVRLIRTTKLSTNKNTNEFLIEVTLSGGELDEE